MEKKRETGIMNPMEYFQILIRFKHKVGVWVLGLGLGDQAPQG